MDEREYILELQVLWPRGSSSSEPNFEATLKTLALADDAVRAFPQSPKLWCMRGDLIQQGSEESAYALEDALLSYERALAVNPMFAEAHESIGYYFDVIDEDFVRSEAAFLEAIRCGGGESSVAGLARVLAERGKPISDILVMIDRHDIDHSSVLKEVREEIASGSWQPEQENEET